MVSFGRDRATGPGQRARRGAGEVGSRKNATAAAAPEGLVIWRKLGCKLHRTVIPPRVVAGRWYDTAGTRAPGCCRGRGRLAHRLAGPGATLPDDTNERTGTP
jgi:hypothetical protein